MDSFFLLDRCVCLLDRLRAIRLFSNQSLLQRRPHAVLLEYVMIISQLRCHCIVIVTKNRSQKVITLLTPAAFLMYMIHYRKNDKIALKLLTKLDASFSTPLEASFTST